MTITHSEDISFGQQGHGAVRRVSTSP